jgi:hypothetical protein
VLVLVASGLKLLGTPTALVALGIPVATVVGSLGWMLARRAAGLPARWRVERARSTAAVVAPTARPSTGG